MPAGRAARTDDPDARFHIQEIGFGGAIHYALSRWRALTRYYDDGRIEDRQRSRTLAASELRNCAQPQELPVCWFDAGGERAAINYSLLSTSQAQCINPEAYLRYVRVYR